MQIGLFPCILVAHVSLQGDPLISLYIYLFVFYLHSVCKLGIKKSHVPNYGLHQLGAEESGKDGWSEGGIAICKCDEETTFSPNLYSFDSSNKRLHKALQLQ